MKAIKQPETDRPPRQSSTEPTRLTAASLARLHAVRTKVMRDRHYTLDAADIIREAREERAGR